MTFISLCTVASSTSGFSPAAPHTDIKMTDFTQMNLTVEINGTIDSNI